MFPDDPFPPLTNASFLLLTFGISTLLFHLVLVFWLKLKKKAWKVVDYIWLGMAVVGLIGAAAGNRQEIARSRLPLSEARVGTLYQPMKFLVDSYSSKNGPVCSFATANRDYQVVCQWFGDVAAKFPLIDKRQLIGSDVLPADPALRTTDPKADPKAIIEEFRSQVGYYNERVKIHEALKEKAKTTAWEESVAFISPLLLAVALALRVTKVTGELRNP